VEKSKPQTKRVRLYNPRDKIIGEFDTVQEAMDYAEEHDLKCYIKLIDAFPDAFN
jgi:hypothetical protein